MVISSFLLEIDLEKNIYMYTYFVFHIPEENILPCKESRSAKVCVQFFLGESHLKIDLLPDRLLGSEGKR